MHSSFSACGQGAADIVQQPRTHRRASLHSAHRPFRAHVISQSGLAEQQPQEQTGAGSQQVQSPQIAQSAPDSAQQQEWMLQAAEDPAAWQPLMAAVPVLVPSGLAKATRLSKPGRAKAGRPPARPKRTSKGAQPDPGAAPKEPPDAEGVEPEQTGTQPPESVGPQAVLRRDRPSEEPNAVSIEEQAALRATYPWLFSDVSDSDTDTLQHRLSFARLLRDSRALLVDYDISQPQHRPTPLQYDPSLITPCLTARTQARQEAARRAARMELPAPLAAAAPVGLSDAALQGVPIDSVAEECDAAWAKKRREHMSYREYVRQLRTAMLSEAENSDTPDSETQGQQEDTRYVYDTRIAYQAGICEDWLQLALLHACFKDLIGPVSAAGIYRMLSVVVTRRRMAQWGPGELAGFLRFAASLAATAAGVLPRASPVQLGWVTYGLAAVETVVDCRHADSLQPLPAWYTYGIAVEDSLAPATQLSQAGNTQGGGQVPQPAQGTVQTHRDTAQAGADRGQGARSARSESAGSVSLVQRRVFANKKLLGCLRVRAEELLRKPQMVAQAPVGTASSPAAAAAPQRSQGPQQGGSDNEWRATQYGQLMWGLGSLGYRPPATLITLVLKRVEKRVDRFQAPQLWGFLWGLARLSGGPGFPPLKTTWYAAYLAACERRMKDFDAQGLVHLVWSVALLSLSPQGNVETPPRDWLRAACGHLAAHVKSATAAQLVAVIESLTVLEYVPRPEITAALVSQARRILHTCTPAELTTLLRAFATITRWDPGQQFVYDYTYVLSRRIAALNPSQGAIICWAYAKLGHMPSEGTWRALLRRVSVDGFTHMSATDLAQALWACAELKAGQTLKGLWVQPAPSSPRIPLYSPTQIVATPHHAAKDSSPEPVTTDDPVDTSVEPSDALAPADSHSPVAQHRGSTSESENDISEGSGDSNQQRPVGLAVPNSDRVTQVVGAPLRQLWVDGWVVAAARLADSFEATNLAKSLWAVGQLGLLPPPALLNSLLTRASHVMSEMSAEEMCEMVGALGTLRYRPDEQWIEAFVTQMQTRLPECEGQDIGVLIWGLASIGAPVTDTFLKAACKACERKWDAEGSWTGDALGQLAWGLAQFGYSPYGVLEAVEEADGYSGMTPAEPLAVLLDATTAAAPDADIATDAWRAMRPGRGPRALEQQWWAGYYRCTRQYWSSATGGSLVLMALGVAGLVKEPPDREWQMELVRALRAGLAKPGQSSLLAHALLHAAGLYTGPPPVGGERGLANVHDTRRAEGTASERTGSAARQLASVATLWQWLQSSGLLEKQPALELLIPVRALHSLWLAVLLDELRSRWGLR